MKGIFLSGSFVRSLSRIGASAVSETSAVIGAGLNAVAAKRSYAFAVLGGALCLGGAFAYAPDFKSTASEKIAYTLALPPAEDRGSGWEKFTAAAAAAANFDALDVARALGAMDDSKRIVAAFEDMGYKLEALRGGDGTVPRVYLRTLPTDLSDVDSIDLRKSVFIKSMLPPILRVNEEIGTLRAGLQAMADDLAAGKALSADDAALIDETAALYDVKTGERATMLRELLRRVDTVPPSLALTQSALESGWGTSRFAQEGNALFGQKAFNDSVDSLLARHKKPEDAHRYRSYDSLLSAVRSYVHNLNSHPAYSEFRTQRAELRKKAGEAPLDGDVLARTLLRYSERGLSYTADLRQMMRSNGMRKFDAVKLEADGATQVAANTPSGA